MGVTAFANDSVTLTGENGARMYLIGFAQDKDVNPQEYFGLKEPLPDDPKHRPLRVSDCERLFKDQP